jgi:hypothetical protein
MQGYFRDRRAAGAELALHLAGYRQSPGLACARSAARRRAGCSAQGRAMKDTYRSERSALRGALATEQSLS